jgi:transposase
MQPCPYWLRKQAELSEHCRKKGLFAEQITAWKENCLQGNAAVVNQCKEE